MLIKDGQASVSAVLAVLTQDVNLVAKKIH
jgi:hypothetical protein